MNFMKRLKKNRASDDEQPLLLHFGHENRNDETPKNTAHNVRKKHFQFLTSDDDTDSQEVILQRIGIKKNVTNQATPSRRRDENIAGVQVCGRQDRNRKHENIGIGKLSKLKLPRAKLTKESAFIMARSCNHIIDMDPVTKKIDEAHKGHIMLPKLELVETLFQEIVASGDLAALKEFLAQHQGFNINSVNFQGLTALHIAVQTNSEDVVEFLLQQDNINIADTVLHAVRENRLKIMVMLLEAQKKVSAVLETTGFAHSASFPIYVTPLVLAAHLNRYEAVEILIERGHTIARPHPSDCKCPGCVKSKTSEDPLYRSASRYAYYKAICSPVLLVHICSDPVLAAFELSLELETAAEREGHMRKEYLDLKNSVSRFAVDLMGCCRTFEEVVLLLKQTAGFEGSRHFVLPRLLMAMDCKQKEFVAHPHTQLVLDKYWIGNWGGWHGKPLWYKTMIVMIRFFTTPVILIMCICLRQSNATKRWELPINKLITHVTSYCVFLFFVFWISNRDRTDEGRGPPQTGVEPVVILYVIGYTWSSIRSTFIKGPKRYCRELWNWSQLIMLGLFYVTFFLWLISAADVALSQEAEVERKYWDGYDPTLLAEGTYCVATILAFLRLIFLCQLIRYFGPLQVCLNEMTADIYRYLLVFAVIIMSFAAGLSKLYQYYDGMVFVDAAGEKITQVSSFVGLAATLHTLFWAIFCMAPIKSIDIVIENINRKNGSETPNKHYFTQSIGYYSFACFEVLSVIVVLNMLIATMFNTFQHVINNAKVECLFAKTEMYVAYMTETTLPSPFNLIPTANGFHSILEWFKILVRRPRYARAKCSSTHCCYVERTMEKTLQKEFPVVMTSLVQRYFAEKTQDCNGEDS